MQNQTADVTWKANGVPVSARFDDPYYSLEDGLAETRHVFLRGNRLPERFRGGFHIAELGFGTGLSFLATLQAWRAAGVTGQLMFTSFEAYPMSRDDLTTALEGFGDLDGLCDLLIAKWRPTGGLFEIAPGVRLEVIIGDARQTLPAWAVRADAWYLDGFSPAKNPELWGDALMRAVATHTAPGGTFATYTAAGFVRRGLEAAGFDVQRIPGFGRKRHMSVGALTP